MRLAHVALWTSDLDGAAEFWRTWFGAGIGEPYHSRNRAGFVSRFVSLPSGDKIELMTGPWVEPGRGEATGWDHVAISLGSEAAVDEMAGRCRDAGILLSGPRTTGDGFYEAVIAMLDGALVEITS